MVNAANPDSPISLFDDSEADPNYEPTSSEVNKTLLTDPVLLASDSTFSPREAQPGSGKKKQKSSMLWKKKY